MRNVIAILAAVAGIALAAYVGIWIMFVGGIVVLIDAVQADPISGTSVAWGLVRIIFASTAAGLTVAASVALAAVIAKD